MLASFAGPVRCKIAWQGLCTHRRDWECLWQKYPELSQSPCSNSTLPQHAQSDAVNAFQSSCMPSLSWLLSGGRHQRLVQAHDAGELEQRLDEGADGFKGWISKLGKQYKLKGKGLWMPVRIALTGLPCCKVFLGLVQGDAGAA